MKCAHCRYSIGADAGLWCQRWKQIAVTPCNHYEREPGADDE